MRRFLLITATLAVAGLYLLTLATGNASKLADYFWWIIGFCGFLIIILFLVLARYIWQLLNDRRNNIFGSKIARRLALMFTLVAVLPGLFLFGVSTQFITHSINSWFGNDTKEALERGVSLSKSALNLSLGNSGRKAANLNETIAQTIRRGKPPRAALDTLAGEQPFAQLTIYNISTNKIVSERNPLQLNPPLLDSETRKQLMQKQASLDIENLANILYAQGWLRLPDRNQQQYALFFREPLPAHVTRDASLIEAARGKYAELSYAKKGLQTFFVITLLIATLLSITLALVAALYFARRFVEPILSLAEGARAVAQGDFSQKRPIYRPDELGRLTHLFNHMTEQLQIAQSTTERNRIEQEAARHYLECVLESLTTGVMTIDNKGHLKTYNHRAEDILGVSLASMIGSDYQQWAHKSPQNAIIVETFAEILATAQADKPQEINYPSPDEARILLAKTTALPIDSSDGLVVVFDDVTMLVRAQKEAAWGEVAKRLAHEIRNPLTPIQLSAERLAWKLHDKLNEQDAQFLTRSTDTIVKQVDAMKEMVEAFRNYARGPSLTLTKLNLNCLVEEILVLYEGSSCTFSVELSNIPTFINADAGSLRQVLHNLFKNAAEAAQDELVPQVHISTHSNDKNKVILEVCNNGKNFSKEMLKNAFEPYVTDKPTGTGLGLPVVKKIIEEHGGRISLINIEHGGACVKIALPELVENKE